MPGIGYSRMRQFFQYFKIFVMSGWLLGFTTTVMSQEEITTPHALYGLDTAIRQAVVVEAREVGGAKAEVTAWERNNDGWTQVFGPWEAVVGRHGLAPFNAKREGDGKTPTGIFELRRAFGYETGVSTGLSYRPVTLKDFWIDDSPSPQYNQWVTGPVPGVSHEALRRNDGLYRYAVIIEYNTNPVIPGLGSAIFLHVWRGSSEPTAGCVAMAQGHVRSLLHWLEARLKPVIWVGPGGPRIAADKNDPRVSSPLRIEIKMKKNAFKIREPVQGTVIVENRYPTTLPAVFNIRLFHDGNQVAERITSVKELPPWKTKFSLKNFGIPLFNIHTGAQGLWRITVTQQGKEDRYLAQAIVRIIPATTP